MTTTKLIGGLKIENIADVDKIHNFKMHGYTATDFKELNYSITDMLQLGFSATELINEKNFDNTNVFLTNDKIIKLLIDNGFHIEYGYGINNSKNIIKTKTCDKYSSIDIYMAKINKDNYFDLWSNILLKNCYTKNGCLLGYKWNNVLLHIPNNYKLKLANTYGSDWMVPKDTKEWSNKSTI